MINKQKILKKIVPFLVLVMGLVFTTGASMAEARSQNPQRDNASGRQVMTNRGHNASHDGNHSDNNHGNHDNDGGMDDDMTPTPTPVPTAEPTPVATAEIFTADLSPEGETTPPILDDSDDNDDSDDQEIDEMMPEGVATFKLVYEQVADEETGTRMEMPVLYYRLSVRNMVDVIGAHIHVGQPGEDGEIVASLFSGDTMGEFNGQLAEGTITESDLIGPLTGDMIGLIELLQSGGLYVNVHTVVNPGGEIRGQITQ